MKRAFAASLLLTASTSPLPCFALEVTLNHQTLEAYRMAFENAAVVNIPDLQDTLWVCHSVLAYGSYSAFTQPLFQFQIAFPQQRMIYSSYYGIPNWMPHWFSEYQGTLTSPPFKTDDFISNGCDEQFPFCVNEGVELVNRSYLRMMAGRILLIEWTTQAHPGLTLQSISTNNNLAEPQKVFMYSNCRLRGTSP